MRYFLVNRLGAIICVAIGQLEWAWFEKVLKDEGVTDYTEISREQFQAWIANHL